MSDKRTVPITLHGLRNQVGVFEGGEARLLVGAIAGASYAGKEGAVLLTVDGKDTETGKAIDIEIAVPRDQVELLIELVRDRRASIND